MTIFDFLLLFRYTPSMRDTLVIDLETKKSFDEVGGEKNIADLGISVAGVWSYAQDAFFALEEHELPRLAEILKNTDHLIGFNIVHFDIPVMRPYMDAAILDRIAVTDIFADAVAFLGHRVGLGGVAKATLGQSKSGHGLEALEWFRQGRIEEVKKYCMDDVRLTRDIYEYGKKHGHILFDSFVDGKAHSIPVAWGEEKKAPVAAVLADAFAARRRVAIEYVSSQDADRMGYRKSRLIDIYGIKQNGEIEAYCHLRSAVRKFNVRRVMSAAMTGETHFG